MQEWGRMSLWLLPAGTWAGMRAGTSNTPMRALLPLQCPLPNAQLALGARCLGLKKQYNGIDLLAALQKKIIIHAGGEEDFNQVTELVLYDPGDDADKTAVDEGCTVAPAARDPQAPVGEGQQPAPVGAPQAGGALPGGLPPVSERCKVHGGAHGCLLDCTNLACVDREHV